VVTPMFPLGVVHFPGVGLPLRVFEPRYRRLTTDCLAADRQFGVVLIERGREVGGGDSRFGVGTMTTVVDSAIGPDGMIHLRTVGTRRVRVCRWLDDDPYPRAEVEDLAPFRLGATELEAMAVTERRVRRALAMRAELNEPAVAFNVELDADPDLAVFQLAAVAPVGPVDHQRLLEAEQPGRFLALLDELIADELAVLASRLAGN
jgi:Lon protease-like protein